jgi:cell fate (sporulation/competence/biofilm development) regulator YlbF (YheA/YmcA/DUF963 family)
VLQQTFTELTNQGRTMQQQFLPQIQQQASTIDMSQVMSMVRGP